MIGYISKNKADWLFQEIFCDEEYCGGSCYKCGKEAQYRNKLLQEPDADVQPVSQWISVEYRLPDIDERVLVYIPKPDNHFNTEIAYISKENDDYPYWVLRDKSQFYSTRFHYISHWQSLPKSPKDGDTNG